MRRSGWKKKDTRNIINCGGVAIAFSFIFTLYIYIYTFLSHVRVSLFFLSILFFFFFSFLFHAKRDTRRINERDPSSFSPFLVGWRISFTESSNSFIKSNKLDR